MAVKKTKIRRAGDQESVRQFGGNYRAFVAHVCKANWNGTPNWRLRGNAYADITNSAWRVVCPICDNPIIHEPGEPFFCPNCMMEGNDGFAMTVVYPENYAEIEAVLMKRPDPKTRNWLHAKKETVADLIKENEAHGIVAKPKKKKQPVKGKKAPTLEELAEMKIPQIEDAEEKPEKPSAEKKPEAGE